MARPTGSKPRDGGPPTITSVIETEKLTKSYGSHRGIIEVDLAAEQGEIFVSREPSLEETFLAPYGREAAEVR